MIEERLVESRNVSNHQSIKLLNRHFGAYIVSFGALSYAFSVLGGSFSRQVVWCAESMFVWIRVMFNWEFNTNFISNIIGTKLGLSCILIGAGLFSPSSNNLIQLLYEKNLQ